MMMDLKQQVKDGDVVPVTLIVESGGKRETIEVRAKVRAATSSGDTMKQHGN
jgi:copper(I)-binding protein